MASRTHARSDGVVYLDSPRNLEWDDATPIVVLRATRDEGDVDAEGLSWWTLDALVDGADEAAWEQIGRYRWGIDPEISIAMDAIADPAYPRSDKGRRAYCARLERSPALRAWLRSQAVWYALCENTVVEKRG